MSGERLTELEWRHREAQRECAAYGHDWQILQTWQSGPIALRCERPCGDPGYRIVRDQPPDARGSDLPDFRTESDPECQPGAERGTEAHGAPACICPRFKDTGGFRIADLCCPTHGVNGTDPGDGMWDDA